MKLRLILSLAAVLLTPLFSFAQPDHPPGPPPAAHEGERPRRGDLRGELKRLAKDLQLTDAQKEQIRPILKARQEAMKDLGREERWGPEGQKIREESSQKIRSLLTPEQQVKFDARVKEMKERTGKGRPGKEGPPPHGE